MTPTTPIIDAHVTAGPTPYGDVAVKALVAVMDQHHIQRAVLSPVDRWLAVDNREGNDTLLAWNKRWPGRLLGYATANPWYGAAAVAEVERALDNGLVGIKLHPARQGFILLDAVVEPLLDLAARRRVPVYVVTGVPIASMPMQLAEVARRYPDAPFIMGRSGRGDFGLMDLIPSVQQAPNIYIETAYNLPSSLELILDVIDSGRVIFASDWPNTILDLEFEKLDRLRLSAAQRTAMMQGNMARLVGLTDTP